MVTRVLLLGKVYLGSALLSFVGYVRYDQVKELTSSVRAPVRALVPSKVGERDMPVDDPDFRKRMEQRCREYDGILAQLAERLTDAGRVRVECEYRLYPGIPRDKICIFNRQQVLHGLYDLSVRMRLHQGDEYYDPKGYRTDLNVWAREGVAEAAVATWTKHFDDLWLLAKRPHWRQEPAPGPTPAA
ncbi:MULTISPECIES: hypothetical protein [unclassified Streptomyces]|uniref:hypothetical protein n=1 Tax=unclassified Streptomyces TaxID=2593676 RepID=UPI003715D381